MSLPRQVKAQIAEVEAYEKEMLEAQTLARTAQTTSEVVAEPVAAAIAEPVVEAEPTERVTPAEPVKREEETWQQRYQTLKGMFDAQVTNVHAQNRDLSRELQQLKDSFEAMKKAPPKVETPPVSSVTDKDKDEFGADLIELQRRIAREMLEPLQTELATMKSENATLREQMGQTGNRVATMTFEQRLQSAIPGGFDKVNADPKWVAWLDEVDPVLRGPRRSVAQAAYEQGDVAAVADYVKLWQSTSTPVTKQPNTRAAELQAQIAPARTASTNAPANRPEDRVYSEAEASVLWDKVADLHRQGKSEAASKLETELNAAHMSGRVR